jgi:3',5'-cyclic AMP phosphodiesterase CpdA
MKFLHLSDLHFHRNKKDNKKAIKVLEFIKANYPKHYLIVTGDITDDGHERQYENAFAAFKAFKGRIFISPGNHDFGAVGNFYSSERAQRFDEMLSIPLEQGGTFSRDNTPVVNVLSGQGDTVMLIALDTNLETDHFFDFACGQVGEKQLVTLNAILSDPAAVQMTKILFFHHHPFMHNHPFLELTDARELMRTIYGRVSAALFGHKHESKLWKDYGSIPYVLAADNSPGKDYAREIVVRQGKLSVKDLKIAENSA